MKTEIDISKYTPEKGVQLSWTGDFRIKVACKDDTVVISANRDGLLSLANHLLNLAQDTVPIGTHIHLDEQNSLEENSKELILEKESYDGQ